MSFLELHLIMMSTAREHTKQISTILNDSLLGIQTKQAILMLFLNNDISPKRSASKKQINT